MKIRVGDWVKIAPRPDPTAYSIIRVASFEHGGKLLYVNGAPWYQNEVCPLYVPDAFALAGVPVPEGAGLHVDGCDLTWTAAIWGNAAGGGFDCTLLLFGNVDGEGRYEWIYQTTDWRESGATIEVDLSRTPIADAWECLPLFVREKLEGYLQEKQK